MGLPKISIVTPSFNQGDYIERTIQSILNQGYPNLEYIIMDGGSSDNSVDIIKKYESEIDFWVSEPDDGMYDAINKGFKRASGDILAWLNSDDVYLNGTLFTVAQIFNDYSEVRWLTSNRLCMNEEDILVSNGWTEPCDFRKFITNDVKIIQQEATFWRAKLFEAYGPIDLQYKYAGDYYLWTQFYQGSRPAIARTVFAAFRLRSENQKTLDSIDTYLEEVERIRLNALKTAPGMRNNERTFLFKVFNRLKLVGILEKAGLKVRVTRRNKLTFPKPYILKYDRKSEKYLLD